MKKTIKIIAEIESLNLVQNVIGAMLDRKVIPQETQNTIHILIDEILNNIIHYAYDSNKGVVSIQICVSYKKTIKLVFMDYGKEYNPLLKEDPDTSVSLEQRAIGGLGIYIVKHFSRKIKYKRQNNKNILILYIHKRRKK